ncbi:unnamed protein product, partial [marine sediment metagenome]
MLDLNQRAAIAIRQINDRLKPPHDISEKKIIQLELTALFKEYDYRYVYRCQAYHYLMEKCDYPDVSFDLRARIQKVLEREFKPVILYRPWDVIIQRIDDANEESINSFRKSYRENYPRYSDALFKPIAYFDLLKKKLPSSPWIQIPALALLTLLLFLVLFCAWGSSKAVEFLLSLYQLLMEGLLSMIDDYAVLRTNILSWGFHPFLDKTRGNFKTKCLYGLGWLFRLAISLPIFILL